MNRHRVFGTGAVLAGVAAIATAVTMIEPPSVMQQRRVDERRVDDVANLERRIALHHKVHDALPATLADLSGTVPRDPVSGQPYGYRVLGADKAELCADFALPAARSHSRYYAANEWEHGAGRTCRVVAVRGERLPAR